LLKYSYINPKGEQSISASPTFCSALSSRNPLLIDDFSDVLRECERLVRSEFSPKPGAINNVRGTWYEWLISIGGFNICQKYSDAKRILVPLPNVISLDYPSLYKKDVYSLIQDLKEKTAAHDVNLISSNPDYVIVTKPNELLLPDVSVIDASALKKIDDFYLKLVGTLNFADLVGFVSIKTSLRPDRRLQLSHEGALVKAFYEHLKSRLWITDAAGLKYYGVSQKVGPADIKGLKTVATHSVLSVNSVPERAVDAVIQVSGGASLNSFLTDVLL